MNFTRLVTGRITDLDKLNLVKIRNGGLVLGSSQFSLLPKIDPCFKSVQNRLENNNLDSSKSVTHSVAIDPQRLD